MIEPQTPGVGKKFTLKRTKFLWAPNRTSFKVHKRRSIENISIWNPLGILYRPSFQCVNPKFDCSLGWQFVNLTKNSSGYRNKQNTTDVTKWKERYVYNIPKEWIIWKGYLSCRLWEITPFPLVLLQWILCISQGSGLTISEQLHWKTSTPWSQQAVTHGGHLYPDIALHSDFLQLCSCTFGISMSLPLQSLDG